MMEYKKVDVETEISVPDYTASLLRREWLLKPGIVKSGNVALPTTGDCYFYTLAALPTERRSHMPYSSQVFGK
jgi:hypothetical protein